MYQGYIKLWRKVFKSNVWKNKNLWRFWTWCLLKASHKKHKILVGFQEVELMPGQFVFGRKQCAKETGLSEQNIRTCIRILNNSELTIKSTNRFSIGTIIKWSDYQFSDNQTNQPSTSCQPASNQQVTTNKNVNNIKNVKNKPYFQKDIPGSTKGGLYKYISCNHCGAAASNIHRGKECPFCGKVVK